MAMLMFLPRSRKYVFRTYTTVHYSERLFGLSKFICTYVFDLTSESICAVFCDMNTMLSHFGVGAFAVFGVGI